MHTDTFPTDTRKDIARDGSVALADDPITITAQEPPPLEALLRRGREPRNGDGEPQPVRRPRLIAMMNQKGGVGKTTTTVNLGAALAMSGHRVLLIDLDPQAHLTLHVGIDPDQLESSVYDLLTDDRVQAADVLHRVNDRLSVIPAEVNLAGAEAELAPKLVDGRAQRVLQRKMESLLKGQGPRAEGQGNSPMTLDGHSAPLSETLGPRPSALGPSAFDFVLIDCPPSLGLLTVNALTFVKEVIVPMQAHFLSLQGLSKLLETIMLIRQSFNPELTVAGTILCMHEKHTLLAGEVSNDLRAFLEEARGQDVPWADAVVFEPTVRRNIKLAECPSFGRTIFDYEPGCAGAKDYMAVAKNVAARVSVST